MEIDVEQVVRDLIDRSLHMSMATVSGHKPWVFEVHFMYDDALHLYWRSVANTRHSQELSANPAVSGNIVGQHAKTEVPQAISFEGRAEVVTDISEKERIAPLFIDRLGSKDTIVENSLQPGGHQFYKVTVDTWYAVGKIGDAPFGKHELAWGSGKN